MAAVIGALRVVIGADTASLEKGLKDAQSSLGGFASHWKKIAVGLGSLVGFAGVTAAIKGVVNEADKLNKLSQSVGVPVEQLSALKYAAELSDISLQQLSTSLGKLAKNLTEAAAKPTSEAANAFRALGVATTDSNGKLRSQETVLLDVAEKFSGLKDGAGKTAVAMAIFGKAGADMIPLLNQGRDGITALTDRAAALGIVISTETAAQAERFNDTLTDIGKISSGVATQVASQLLPTLQNLAGRFANLFANGDAVTGIARGIGAVFIYIADQAELLTHALARLGVTWDAFKNAVSTLPFTDASKKAWSEFSAVVEQNKKLTDDLRWRQSMQGVADGFGYLATTAPAATKALKDFNFSALGGGKNALDQYVASLAKKQAGMNAELATIGLSTGAHERLKIILEAEAIAKEKNIPITEALRSKIEALATTYGNTAQKVEEAKERFSAIQGSMQGIASKFEDALVGIADGSKKAKDAFADMARGILSDLIRLIIRMQITIPIARALTAAMGGGFGGFGGGGMPAFAGGGSFEVGGSGGIDSKVMAFRATPGEMVNITKGDQQAGGGWGQIIVENHGTDIDIQRSRDGRMRIIAKEVADEQIGRQTPNLVAGQLSNPNSPIGKSMRRNTTAEPRR